MSKLPSNLHNLIPGYILEQYPNFVLFLRGYYEWMTSGDRPHAVLSKHLDRLSFKESLDEYTNALKNKYLPSIPVDVIANKELLIKWSANFYRAKGSFHSYEFLFKILFESSVEMYLPKNEIFRLSDGKWINDESVVFVTLGDGVAEDAFLYKKIKQVRQVYNDVYEYAYASVQRINIRSYGGYKLTELYISGVKGEFKPGYSIENDTGDTAWLLPISATADVVTGGINFQGDDVLTGGLPPTYDMTYVVDQQIAASGLLDTHVNTFFNTQDLVFKKNGQVFTPVAYDGQKIRSLFAVDDIVTVTFPTYPGLISVSEVQGSSIKSVNILDPIIGNFGTVNLHSSLNGVGSGADVQLTFGVVSPRTGYYINTDGWLSADRYLQDSRFYQEYSYVLRTEVDINRYQDVVERTIHPAGMKMFGIVSIADVLSMLMDIIEDDISPMPGIINELTKYSLGPNFSMIDRLKAGLDPAVWNIGSIDETMLLFWTGTVGYRLHDYKMIVKGLFTDTSPEVINEIGWMTSCGFADQDIATGLSSSYVSPGYIDDGYFGES